jgi:hypothetical protein
MINPNDREHWPRWTKIAFFRAIDAVKGPYKVYLEGDERTTRLDTNFSEVRLDGPDIYQPAAGCFVLSCILNVLMNCKEDSNDLYSPDRITGQFSNGFTDCISVHRRGNGPDDDQSFVGQYILKSTITQNQFGLVDENLRVIQTTLEATYEMSLNEEP